MNKTIINDTGKIIFIEGNPGSGKTSFSQRLKADLTKRGYQVKHFQEGDLHPIDLAWCAILNESMFKDIQLRYPDLNDDIIRFTKKVNDHYIFAYTKVDYHKATKAFYQEMETYEIYRSNDMTDFKKAHMELWQSFSEERQKDKVYIFECIYLQNHINQLMLKYDLSNQETILYFKDLMNPLIDDQPHLFFIFQDDVEAVIKRISEERRTNDKDKFQDWIDRVVGYIGAMPNAKKNNYIDYQGTIQYFKDRQRLSIEILEHLPLEHTCVTLKDDYEIVYNKIKDKTLSLLENDK